MAEVTDAEILRDLEVGRTAIAAGRQQMATAYHKLFEGDSEGMVLLEASHTLSGLALNKFDAQIKDLRNQLYGGGK